MSLRPLSGLLGGYAFESTILVATHPQKLARDGVRFCMGLALGVLLPCIASVICHSRRRTPSRIGGHLGIRPVFLGTCLLLAIGAGFN